MDVYQLTIETSTPATAGSGAANQRVDKAVPKERLLPDLAAHIQSVIGAGSGAIPDSLSVTIRKVGALASEAPAPVAVPPAARGGADASARGEGETDGG